MQLFVVNHINNGVNGDNDMLTDLFESIEALRVIDFLLDNADGEFNKSQLAEQAGVSRPTLHYKILPRFKKLGLIKIDGNNRFQIVTLNLESPLVQSLLRFDNEIADAALDSKLFEEAEAATQPDEEYLVSEQVYRYIRKEYGEQMFVYSEENIHGTEVNAPTPLLVSGRPYQRRNQHITSSTA